MGLVTINDMISQPREMLAKYMMWAGDLLEMYENFVRDDEEDVSFAAGWNSAKGRSDGIHASEMSGECRRPVYYSLKKVPRADKPLDPGMKKRFRVGHVYHAMVQDDWRRLCERSGGLMSFEKEVRIDPKLQLIAEEYNIKSSCDGVITFRDKPWGEAVMRVALEIKTESPDQFAKLTEPKLQHRRQTCVYMRCLDTPICWTQYINKGNQNIKPSKHPFLFFFDHQLWGQIEKETQEVIHLATINEVPPRVEGFGCEFCGFSKTCQPEYLKKAQQRVEGKARRAVVQARLRRNELRQPKTGGT